MNLACLDLEGVLVPEIWISFAEKTGIRELRLTTRDVPDYDVLMKGRLKILAEHKFKLEDIQDVIGSLRPLDGAHEFLDWLRTEFQVVILSDTFYEFAMPLMKQLGYPTLFCHSLKVAPGGAIADYQLRIKDQKKLSVEAFRRLQFKVVAAGDSYNDTAMLAAAHQGILFCPPDNVKKEFPQFPVAENHKELRALFGEAGKKLSIRG
ncbi:MAG TPA: bifunctional phosphoserine phosphatase/homoserine phosphotransferase ThrH [bacterium]|nr:bifunctional phosphoserine phosphatase/homoserine phosphotransferase ThrH [bacterium]